MPELPEVQTVCEGMKTSLLHKHVIGVSVMRRDLRAVVSDDFETALENSKICRIFRRGKHIILENDKNRFFILHLGMSGRVKIFSADQNYHPEKHDHIILRISGGGTVVYHDPRRFGLFQAVPEGMNWSDIPPFDRMGAEPLEGWSGEELFQGLSRRKMPVKQALLDQNLVAGLGNIYVCEALCMSGISPLKRSNEVTPAQARKLAACCIDVLEKAIAAGGSTLKDYRHTDGGLGYFQYGFSVYGREGQECKTLKCDEKILRIVQGGRSTFYCPNCQK